MDDKFGQIFPHPTSIWLTMLFFSFSLLISELYQLNVNETLYSWDKPYLVMLY